MRWLLSIALLVHSVSHGANVLVQGLTSSDLDYQAMLKAQPEYASPSQTHLQSRPLARVRDALISAYSRAQKSFLEGSRTEAQAGFAAVYAMSIDDDWSSSDREILLNACLRLAQLSGDVRVQDEWLLKSLLVAVDLEPEHDLFPPPLVERRAQLRKAKVALSIPESWFAEGWSLILINGMPCSRLRCPSLPALEEDVRITALSEKFLTQTQIVSARDLDSARLRRIPWVSGECGNERFHDVTVRTFAIKEAFWNFECGQEVARPLDLKPVAALPETLPKFELREKPRQPFYRRTWFWVGAGVATAALAVFLIESGKKDEHHPPPTATQTPTEVEPTTTYGN